MADGSGRRSSERSMRSSSSGQNGDFQNLPVSNLSSPEAVAAIDRKGSLPRNEVRGEHLHHQRHQKRQYLHVHVPSDQSHRDQHDQKCRRDIP
ncbi:MAG: hypothetical protein MZU97_12810 [Bacillus subtilis]|nr:hypothetical protein [Bacillus subtilis]